MSDGSPIHPDELKFNVDVKSESLAPIFVKIEKQMDVIHVLHAYALKLKLGLIILSALGFVRNVMITLPLPSKKTYDEGIYQIMSLSGRITPLKTGEIDGDINLVMSDIHGATVGGIVKNLVAETTVEVIVCPSYYDPSKSHPFDFDPPMIFGNPFLPTSNNQSVSQPSSSHPSSSKPSSSHSSERTSSYSKSSKPSSSHPSSSELNSTHSSSNEPTSNEANSMDASSIDVSYGNSNSSDPNSPDPSL
ncbi:hypothetical protein AALP_AA6G029900 [Arabis alpina]|uniref:AT-hook motif nuclear-localized protein n=1 Tax=Arabis alpina TaxID=50452 RepID=A0A087GLR4_ARAAL|nr:hypothetical protein AALP_AA6G029900 [Arabis alpina]